ncbi:MAG: hypothetical protein RMJ37_05695 [Spirochaetia bacterium]|nr:hypothetical protein [Spirochaetota bacterium]MCX8097340.1 hypothetical protein [Spirochaetota bacterium]MDW8112811.1 hypothetical protein [Spirochaetia bacterium]
MKVKDVIPYLSVALVSLGLGVGLTLIVSNLLIAKPQSSSHMLNMFGLTQTKPQSYILRVGDYYLSTADFDKEYMFVVETLSGGDPNKKSLYLNDLSTKRNYLDTLVNEIVLVIDAYNQGYLSSPDWNIISRVSLRKSVVDGFLLKKIDVSKIQVSDKEVEDLYNKNRDYFRQNNIPAERAEELLRAQLRSQKLQQEVAKYIQGVRDKLNIEKVEENIK